jgi:iron(III) transport system permease protein
MSRSPHGGGPVVSVRGLTKRFGPLLLAPIGFQTLATLIWNATEDGFLAKAGAESLVLGVASGVLTWLLTIRRIDQVGT